VYIVYLPFSISGSRQDRWVAAGRLHTTTDRNSAKRFRSKSSARRFVLKIMPSMYYEIQDADS